MGRVSLSSNWLPMEEVANFVHDESPTKNTSVFLEELQHVHRSRSRHLDANLSFKDVALFVAYVSVVLMLLKFCLHLHKRAADPGPSSRRLAERGANQNGSDGGESSLHLKQCVALEHRGARNASAYESPKEEEEVGPSAKVPRVSSPDMHGTVPTFGLLSPIDTSTLQPQCQSAFECDDEAVVESFVSALARDVGTAPEVLGRPEFQQLLPSSFAYESSAGSSSSFPLAFSFLGGSSQVGLQLEQLAEGPTRAQSSTDLPPSQTPGASTGVSAPALEPGANASEEHSWRSRIGYELHRFYRFPTVHPSVCPPQLDVSIVLHPGSSLNTPIPRLKRIRSVLLKPQLGIYDVRKLLEDTALLAKRAISTMGREPSEMTPRGAVQALGLRLLVFDAILAVHQTLGESLRLNLWWDNFKSAVATDYSIVLKRNHTVRVQKFLDMAKCLSDALQMYKQQIRPSPEQVVMLKRMLFCNVEAPAFFKKAAFDPWRDDDKLYLDGFL